MIWIWKIISKEDEKKLSGEQQETAEVCGKTREKNGRHIQKHRGTEENFYRLICCPRDRYWSRYYWGHNEGWRGWFSRHKRRKGMKTKIRVLGIRISVSLPSPWGWEMVFIICFIPCFYLRMGSGEGKSTREVLSQEGQHFAGRNLFEHLYRGNTDIASSVRWRCWKKPPAEWRDNGRSSGAVSGW